MFRYLLRSLLVTRKPPLESSDLLSKCDKGDVYRFASEGGLRSLCSTSVRLCDSKHGAASSDGDDKPNAEKERGPTEPPPSTDERGEVEDKYFVAEESQEKEKPMRMEKDDESATQTQPTLNAEQQKQEKAETAKTGKEGLLDLLGAMKVEVTNKRMAKRIINFKQSYESMPTSKPPAMESTISMFQQATLESSTQSKPLDPELAAAASAAASTLPNRSQAESELLKKLREHESIAESQRKGDIKKLGGLIADMKVGKKPNRHSSRPSSQIQFDEDGRGYTRDRSLAGELEGIKRRRNLALGKRLNIFSPSTDEKAEPVVVQPTIWDIEFAKQLAMSINHQPRNGLEEMIQWTKEGKLWQYPINNEDGLEEEASISFSEHVFLEKHLEEGFPRQGPVRQFMELVVIGLSKNPYLTVQQKKDHIFWFRDYFNAKEEVLKEAAVYLN